MRTGSVSETARECFCHRNTVLNRIKAFGELTSLDLNVPGDLALAYLFVEKTGGSLVAEGASGSV
jgi:DNA-binding PucR family transcriptional regulator